MARLIDADRLAAFPHEPTSGTEDIITEWIEEIFSIEEIIDHKEDLEKLCWKVINGFIGVIETEPTVDAVEVVHGEWIDAYPDIEPNPLFMYGICSVCGCKQSISHKLNYCMDCGAKMDGGKKDEM